MQRVMATRLAEQSVLPADTLEVKASLARAQQQQIVIADNIALAKEQLNLLLGRDPETLFEVAPVEALLPVESDLLAARARAIENRPELKQADLKARAAEYDRRVKKAERLPDVGGFVSYLSPFNIDVVPRNVAAAGIQVTWEPFDWGRKKIELSGKTRAVEQARLVAQHTRDAVLVEVNDAFRRLREANAQVQVAQIDQEAAQERLRVLKNQLEQKAALVSDVLALERKVAEAQYHKQEAMVAFWNAKADFAKAIGEE
jgi:outer membrane protein TolC